MKNANLPISPLIEPGMYFCSTSIGEDRWFSKLISSSIRRFEKMKSSDGSAFYTHAGIITGMAGKTFEARSRYGFYNIDDYKGGPILIGKARGMSLKRFSDGMITIYQGDRSLMSLDGKMYPYHVLLMMAVPMMAYIRPSGKPVCSECVAIHMMNSRIGSLAEQVGQWKNQTPDSIADMIKKWDLFDVVYEGEWPGLKKFNGSDN